MHQIIKKRKYCCAVYYVLCPNKRSTYEFGLISHLPNHFIFASFFVYKRAYEFILLVHSLVLMVLEMQTWYYFKNGQFCQKISRISRPLRDGEKLGLRQCHFRRSAIERSGTIGKHISDLRS